MPGIGLSQILEGEASAESFKNLFLSPDRLSPEQRTDLADRLVGGGDRFTKTLVGVATNPWVWLMFVTSPVGAKALQAGKNFSFVGKAFNEWAKKSTGFLDFVRTDLDVFRRFEGGFLGMADDLQKLHHETGTAMAKAEVALFERFNQTLGRRGEWALDQADPLNLLHYRKGTPEYAVVEMWDKLTGAKAHKLDEALEAAVPHGELKYHLVTPEGQSTPLQLDPLVAEGFGVKRAALKAARKRIEGDVNLAWTFYKSMPGFEKRQWSNFEEFQQSFLRDSGGMVGLMPDDVLYTMVKNEGVVRRQSKLLDGDLHAAIQGQFGEEGQNYLRVWKEQRQKTFVHALGDEKYFAETGQYRPDYEKWRGVVTSLDRALKTSSGDVLNEAVKTVQGKELLLQIVDTDGLHTLKGAANKEEQLKKVIDELTKTTVLDTWDDLYWRPRNTYGLATVNVNGRRVTPGESSKILGEARRQVEFAPLSALNDEKNLARISPLTNKELYVNPDDIEWFRGRRDLGLDVSLEGEGHINQVRNHAERIYAKGQDEALMVLNLGDGDTSRKRFFQGMHEMAVMDTRPVGADRVAALDDLYLGDVPEDRRHLRTTMAGGYDEVSVGERVPDQFRDKVTWGDLANRYYARLSSPALMDRFRTVALPNTMGKAGNEWLAVQNSHIRNKELANWFANGWAGKLLEKTPWGRQMVERMREFGDFNNRTAAKDYGGMVANYLYTTHLGLNLGSIVMQLTQPLLLAGTAGSLDDVAGAYVDAASDMGRYAEKRVGLGARFLSPLEEDKLLRETMPFTDFDGHDLLQVGGGKKLVDVAGYRPGGVMGKVSDFMLGGFQKAEMFNRNFSAHLMKRMYAKAGRSLDDPGVRQMFAQDAKAFMLRTQYGTDPLNTPNLFQKGFLRSPLARMFLTFPLRSATGVLDTFPRMGGEENYWNGLKNTVLRGMGMSAVVYEVGKGLLGADLSRGLFAGSATSIAGGDRLLDKNSQILPIPPIVDIPVGLLRGVANEDMGMLANSIARVVPGGVAINRAVGLLPMLPKSPLAGLPGVLQKQYVDYSSPLPSGEVPVFKADGTLISYRRPSEIVAKSLGVDLGTWEQEGGLDAYLAKQREEIVGYRQRYLMALASNDVPKAQSVAADFQKKFKGLPLTVTKEQVSRYLRARVVGRTERSLDRIPPEVRWQYQKMVEMGGGVPNLEEGGISQATSTGRDPFRRGMSPLQAESLLAAQAQAQGTTMHEAPPTGAFQGFAGFR